MAFKPSFDALSSQHKSTGIRLTPVQEEKVTTKNTPKPTPSPRGHA